MDVTAGAPAIVFSKAESSDLVDTLGSSSHPWSRLDSVSFSKIALVLMYTEACPAQNEGLFRLYTTLEDLVDKLDEQRYAFKDAVGQALLNPLAIFFLDRRINTLARRWVGLILVNLLETEGNRATLLKICGSDANATRLHFGKIVVEGIYKILKVIAGRVISDLSYDYKYDPESLREFLLSFLPNDQDAFDFLFECGDEFPVDGSPSQWEAQLFEYTSRIEGVRENLKLR